MAATAADVDTVVVDGGAWSSRRPAPRWATSAPLLRRRDRAAVEDAMTASLVTGIGELVTNDPGAGDGPARAARRRGGGRRGRPRSPGSGRVRRRPAADARVDVGGRAVLPGFVDSHAHLVFAGDRAAEFAARMAGEPYDGGRHRARPSRPPAAATDDDAARAAAPAASPRCARRARPPSRSRAATA